MAAPAAYQKPHLAALNRIIPSMKALPQSAQTMFIEGLPALGEHPFGKVGEQFLQLVIDAAKEDAQMATQELEMAKTSGAAATEKTEVLTQSLDEAKEALEAARTGTTAQAAACEAAKVHLKDAQDVHTTFEKEIMSHLRFFKEVRDQHSEVKALHEGHFKALVEGTTQNVDIAAAEVERFFAGPKCDKVIAAAAAVALRAVPDARAEFDKVTVDAAGKVFAGRLAELAAKIEESAKEEAEIRAELLGLWAIADVAGDAMSAAQKALVEATNSEAAAVEDVKEKQVAVSEQEKHLSNERINEVLLECRIKESSEAITAVEAVVAGPPPPPPAVEEPTVEEPLKAEGMDVDPTALPTKEPLKAEGMDVDPTAAPTKDEEMPAAVVAVPAQVDAGA